MMNYDAWFFEPLDKIPEPQVIDECDICHHEIMEGDTYYDFGSFKACEHCVSSACRPFDGDDSQDIIVTKCDICGKEIHEDECFYIFGDYHICEDCFYKARRWD